MTLVWIVLTPTDQKNAFLWGFSISRWIIILLVSGITIASAIGFLKHAKVLKVFSQIVDNPARNNLFQALTGLSLVFFWFCIWVSPDFMPSYKFEVERIKPVLVLLSGLLSEGLLFFQFYRDGTTPKDYWQILKRNKKTSLILCGAYLVISLVFIGLNVFGSFSDEKALAFPPGPPGSPFQVLSGIFLFLVLFFFTGFGTNKVTRSQVFGFLIPILIWGITFALWAATPFVCTDDRPGPYPPNNICYPQVDDSVYSIGSHYITLGRGVFNHWFTDKPFYMLFLAIGQFIAGPQIDRYLLFQTGVLALISVLLYMLGKKFSGQAGGMLLAFLSIVLGINNIKYYATTGGVHAKLENSEILTSLLLILFCLVLVKFFSSKGKVKWALLAGGFLGLACLTRINPVFILPTMILFLIFVFWKNWRKWFPTVIALVIGFSIVFIPWLFFANDGQGNNYYLQKIQNVLFYRYQSQTSKDAATGKEKVANEIQSPYSKTVSSSKIAALTIPGLEPMDSVIDSVSTIQGNTNTRQDAATVMMHFLNNEFISLAKLPVNFRITRLDELLNQSIWLDSHRLPFWKLTLSVENLLVLSVNLLFILLGLIFAFRNWGVTGLVPLVIQVGYHLANGFALTSGERYLEPVEWVTLLYFVLGIYCITKIFFPGSRPVEKEVFSPDQVIEEYKFRAFFTDRRNITVLFILVVLGSLLPATYLLKDKLPETKRADLIDIARTTLLEQELTTRQALNQFVKDPDAVIVEGYAYHPRLYYSPLVFKNLPVFELTVLAREKVYISNFQNIKKPKTFTDGTKVILLGCKIREKNFWGAKSVLVRTIGYIDVDKKIAYKNKWSKLECK